MTPTTEQLRALRVALKSYQDGYDPVDDKEQYQMFVSAELAVSELLASRAAQPVAYASEETLAYAKEGEKSLVTWSEPMGDAVIPLFTTPPAPAVPEEIITAPIDAMRCGPAASYVLGWNACRAAMLAQPVSSGYKLPDGFKLMPLEMTDEIGEAIAMEARCCGGIALCIYEAALAAAPEGGNG